LDEFNLGENATLKTLYAIRQEWVPAFFKKDYCGTMVSTQQGESVNHIVKKCHVDANTPLHEFAKQMMKLLHRRKMTYNWTYLESSIQILSHLIFYI
jgi:hypothetical protein